MSTVEPGVRPSASRRAFGTTTLPTESMEVFTGNRIPMIYQWEGAVACNGPPRSRSTPSRWSRRKSTVMRTTVPRRRLCEASTLIGVTPRGRLRLAFVLLGVLSLTLGTIGVASALPQAPSKYGGTLVVGLSSVDIDTLDPTLTRARGLEIESPSASSSTTTTPSHGSSPSSPPRCRRSRRTSSPTRSRSGRGSSSTTARRSTPRPSSPRSSA